MASLVAHQIVLALACVICSNYGRRVQYQFGHQPENSWTNQDEQVSGTKRITALAKEERHFDFHDRFANPLLAFRPSLVVPLGPSRPLSPTLRQPIAQHKQQQHVTPRIPMEAASRMQQQESCYGFLCNNAMLIMMLIIGIGKGILIGIRGKAAERQPLLEESCCDPNNRTVEPIFAQFVDKSQSGSEEDKRQQKKKYVYPDLEKISGHEKEFQELGDTRALYEGAAKKKVKVRQHVNPLASKYQVPTPAPDWEAVYADPTLPLQVDVGCASGRFVLLRAQRLAGREESKNEIRDGKAIANVLGLEIREALVDRALTWAQRLNLSNCHFICTNVTNSWKSLLSTYPGPIELVTMQFPDPHFKKKHHKRRHVQPQLVRDMAESMAPGARIFLQGDVPEVVRWMRDMFDVHGDGCFTLAPECKERSDLIREEWETEVINDGKRDSDRSVDIGTWSTDATAGWLSENPLGVPTEREVYVSQINAPVYRLMLVRA